MTRKTWIFASAAALIVAATALAGTQPGDDALDPVKVAPETHKIAFENAFVRIPRLTGWPCARFADQPRARRS